MKYLHLIWAALFRSKTRTLADAALGGRPRSCCSACSTRCAWRSIPAAKWPAPNRMITSSRLSITQTLPYSLDRRSRRCRASKRRVSQLVRRHLPGPEELLRQLRRSSRELPRPVSGVQDPGRAEQGVAGRPHRRDRRRGAGEAVRLEGRRHASRCRRRSSRPRAATTGLQAASASSRSTIPSRRARRTCCSSTGSISTRPTTTSRAASAGSWWRPTAAPPPTASALAIDALARTPTTRPRPRPRRAFNQAFAKQFADIGLIVSAIMGAVFFTLLLLTGNTMAQAVRERIPELAVLKTIGFSNRSVLWLVLAESILLVVLGGLIGLGIARAVMPAVSAASGGLIQLPGVLAQTWVRRLAADAGDRRDRRAAAGAARDAPEHRRCTGRSLTEAHDMKRFKGFLAGFGIVLALVAGLVAWIMLPWYAVAGLAVLIALWLVLTRSGRLALAATSIGIAGLPQRWGASLVIVVGIAGVVGVLVAMLAMGEGFKATLDKTGGTDTAIVLRAGSQAETNSVITRDQVPLITHPARHRQGRGRQAAGFGGAVADHQPAEHGRRHRRQRAAARRGSHRLGAAAEGEDRRRPQVRRRPARDRGRPRRAGAVPRAADRQAAEAGQPGVDGGRRVRIRRLARVRAVGGCRACWARPTSAPRSSR